MQIEFSGSIASRAPQRYLGVFADFAEPPEIRGVAGVCLPQSKTVFRCTAGWPPRALGLPGRARQFAGGVGKRPK